MSADRIDEAIFSVVTTTPAQIRRLVEALPSAMIDADLDAGWSPKHVVPTSWIRRTSSSGACGASSSKTDPSSPQSTLRRA